METYIRTMRIVLRLFIKADRIQTARPRRPQVPCGAPHVVKVEKTPVSFRPLRTARRGPVWDRDPLSPLHPRVGPSPARGLPPLHLLSLCRHSLERGGHTQKTLVGPHPE